MIELTVEGSPVALKRHKHLRNGHTYDPSKADKRYFLASVLNMAPKSPEYGPISMTLEFYVQRPKSHYRTGKYSHILKDNAPTWHTSRADIDNLVKLVLDALNGVFYKDDSQICHLETIKKYSNKPRTVVQMKGVE
jgi:Holliday junction resolvase RusA-like endonuclease